MTTYVDFGPQGTITGGPDNTGYNSGNWTLVIDQSVFGNQGIPAMEIYEMSITCAPGAVLTMYKNGKNPRTFRVGFNHLTAKDGAGEYMKPGDSLWLCFSDPIEDGIVPTCTFQIRADADHPLNKQINLPGVLHR